MSREKRGRSMLKQIQKSGITITCATPQGIHNLYEI